MRIIKYSPFETASIIKCRYVNHQMPLCVICNVKVPAETSKYIPQFARGDFANNVTLVFELFRNGLILTEICVDKTISSATFMSFLRPCGNVYVIRFINFLVNNRIIKTKVIKCSHNAT